MLQSFLMVPIPPNTNHPWLLEDSHVHYLRKHDDLWWFFPRGFVDMIRDRLARHGIASEHQPNPGLAAALRRYDPSGYDALYLKLRHQYQQWAAHIMWTNTDGIAELPTRFGKSYTLATSYVATGRPLGIVLVPRSAIIDQGTEELSEFLGEEVGWICTSQGAPNPRNLTFVSPGSIVKDGAVRPEWIEYLSQVEAVWFDECHISGDMIRAIMLATQNRVIQWGLSATPFTDDTLKNFEIIGFTGPVRAEMKTKEAADLGLVAQMNVRLYDVWFGYQTTWEGSIDTLPWADYYRLLVVTNQALNEHIAQIALTHIEAGQSVAIFVERVEHGEVLQKLIPGSVANVGPLNKARQQQVKKQFNEGIIPCVIATKRWREGVTIHTDVLINAEGLKAAHVQRQKFGRGLMPKQHGMPLVYYDFIFHDAPREVLLRHSKARLRTYNQDGWPVTFVGDVHIVYLQRDQL